jgi:hypothetical protein
MDVGLEDGSWMRRVQDRVQWSVLLISCITKSGSTKEYVSWFVKSYVCFRA